MYMYARHICVCGLHMMQPIVATLPLRPHTKRTFKTKGDKADKRDKPTKRRAQASETAQAYRWDNPHIKPRQHMAKRMPKAYANKQA